MWMAWLSQKWGVGIMLEDQRDQRIAKLEKQVQVLREILLNMAPIVWEVENPMPSGIALIDSYRDSWRRQRDAFINSIELQLNS